MVVETEKFLIEKKLKRFLALKIVNDIPSFFILTRDVMEYIEKFAELNGLEKKIMITKNILLV